MNQEPKVRGITPQCDVEALRLQLLRQDEFLSVAADELRNPMHGLSLQLASAKALAEGVVGAGEVAERLARAQASLSRYLDRAIVLLDLARLDAGRYPVSSSEVDLGGLLGAQVERLRRDAGFHGLALHYQKPSACRIETDPLMVEQIVGNLISNAIKHSGGDRIEIRLTLDAAGTARIEVDDNGHGITPAERSRLFSEFDPHRRQEKPGPGFGLGLWIARQLSRALGATVSLEGKLGPGSVFRLTLPTVPIPER